MCCDDRTNSPQMKIDPLGWWLVILGVLLLGFSGQLVEVDLTAAL
jgi:hypothetical protein